MTKVTRSIEIKGDIEEIYNRTLSYFTSIGFTTLKEQKPTFIRFKRGSLWAEGGGWRAKRCKASIKLRELHQELVLIEIIYKIGLVQPTSEKINAGKKVTEEVEKLKQYLLPTTTNIEKKSEQPDDKERICVECEKNIPWDAKFCPYCGHKYDE